MTTHPFVPLTTYEEYPVDVMRRRLHDFYTSVNLRRTVREFSDRPVPRDIIEDALRAAGTAPSGANLQPWHFSVVCGNETKCRIRLAAEIEEKEFYEHRASPEWLRVPLSTSHEPRCWPSPPETLSFIYRSVRTDIYCIDEILE